MKINKSFIKNYLSQVKNRKVLLFIMSLSFFIIYFSVFIDSGSDVSTIYNAIIGGIPSRDFIVLSIIRFLTFYLFYMYIFSISTDFSNNSYLYLTFIRLKNVNIWYQNTLIYSILLSIIYWGLVLICLIAFLLIIALFRGEIGIFYISIFSKETFLFFVFSVLSSVSLANVFILLKNMLKKENIAFAGVFFLLVSYVFSYYIFGQRHILFLNTSILTVERIQLSYFEENGMLINFTWQFIQNLIVSVLTIINLKRKGLE